MERSANEGKKSPITLKEAVYLFIAVDIQASLKLE